MLHDRSSIKQMSATYLSTVTIIRIKRLLTQTNGKEASKGAVTASWTFLLTERKVICSQLNLVRNKSHKGLWFARQISVRGYSMNYMYINSNGICKIHILLHCRNKWNLDKSTLMILWGLGIELWQPFFPSRLNDVPQNKIVRQLVWHL